MQSPAPVAQADFRTAIGWAQPWMTSLCDSGEALCRPGIDWRSAVNAIARSCMLATENGHLIEFVAQSELPVHASYEAFIHATGKVPTRDNLHDFLNALIWLHYPLVKARLNAMQAADIASTRSPTATQLLSAPARRSRHRDALTLFDENAVLVATSDWSLNSLLRQHAWSDLFVDRRAMLGTCYDVFPFGHALIEKLVVPYKAITAHAWLILVEPQFFEQSTSDKVRYLDQTIARQLDGSLQTLSLTPLPVLGVPGWWPAQNAAFYADQDVFRPLRTVG